MAYRVHTPGPVRDYILGLTDLSAEGKLRVFENYQHDLSRHADACRVDRLAPDSPCFWYTQILADSGHYHAFRFVVNDSGAASGALVIEYVEHHRGNPVSDPPA